MIAIQNELYQLSTLEIERRYVDQQFRLLLLQSVPHFRLPCRPCIATEVPAYGTLMDIVASVNAATLAADPRTAGTP